MSQLDEIFRSLPMQQIAQQVGASESDVQQATAAVLPALFGGLQANAQDPAGAASIEEALTQHSPELVDGDVDLSQVDPNEGQKIASHIFGSNEDAVAAQLGGLGGPGISQGLVRKLIPILAPIVMAYLAKQVLGGTTAGQQERSGGGALGSVLGSILGGGLGGGRSSGGLGDVLGQVLGGGQAQEPQQTQTQAPQIDPQPRTQAPAPTSSGNGGIDDLIEGALNNGAPAQTSAQGAQGGMQQGDAGLGGLLGGVLGGLLGGGRR